MPESDAKTGGIVKSCPRCGHAATSHPFDPAIGFVCSVTLNELPSCVECAAPLDALRKMVLTETVDSRPSWVFAKGELPCSHFWRDKTVDCCELAKGHDGDHRGTDHKWSSPSSDHA